MFDILFTFIDNIVTSGIGGMVVSLITVITPLIGACVGLYAVYIVYKSLYDSEDIIFMEALKFMVALALVTTVALSATWYMSKLVPFVLGAGDDIANALLGGGGAAKALQAMFDQMLGTLQLIWAPFSFNITEAKSWLNMLLFGFQSLVIIIGNMIFIILATGYLLVAKFMLGILLIIGPIFIMMSFFPSSRSMFQSWTGQVFNNTLLTIAFPVAFSFFKATLDNTVYMLTPTMEACLMTLVVFGALILLSMQIPTLCSTLSGGFGISGINMQALGGAKAAGSAAASAKAGAGNAYQKLKNIGKGGVSPG